jgi:hypothetical protein
MHIFGGLGKNRPIPIASGNSYVLDRKEFLVFSKL